MEQTNEARQLKKDIISYNCYMTVQKSKKPFEDVRVTLNRREIEASGRKGSISNWAVMRTKWAVE